MENIISEIEAFINRKLANQGKQKTNEVIFQEL